MKLPRKKKIFGSTWRILQIDCPIDERVMPVNGFIYPFSKTIYIKKSLSKDIKLKTYAEMILKAAFSELNAEIDHESFAKMILSLFKVIPK